MSLRLLSLLALIVMLCSCRATKTIQTAIVKKDTVSAEDLSRERARLDSIAFIQDSYRQLAAHHIIYTTFTAKMDVDYEEGDGKRLSVNAQVRIYKDSVIWASLTALLGIEGLRAYITRDSVKLLDKQNKVYIARSVAYLREITALPLDLFSLQELLVGNPVFFDSTFTSYSRAPGTISLHGVNTFFKLLFTIGETDKLLQSAKFDDLDEIRNRTSFLLYGEYENKAGFPFSLKRNISVSEKKKLNVEIRYRQYAFNETLSFPFSVPKNYRRD
ncbi:MAG: DUF4292 domain-containing protein [Bacteroidetes bacterium]|nr:DUF4292 domain-containing protein [Bacteroidota bacterium]